MPKLQLSGLDIAHDIIPKGIPSLRISQYTPNVIDIQSHGCLGIMQINFHHMVLKRGNYHN